MTTIVCAGGCFWCIDAVMRQLKGVSESVSGYAGGSKMTAHYPVVSTGVTKHAESVQVTFDESIIPLDTLLDIFFLIHDPTTKNRQGADVGPQYRSALFYADDVQKVAFEQSIARAQLTWDQPIVTELNELKEFFPGESEHQDYFANNPDSGYCSIVIVPKIAKARQAYRKWFIEEAA